MLDIFLSLEDSEPLGICIFSDYGFEHVTLEDFMSNSKVDLSDTMRHRYAAAFEIMAKQLRDKI